MLALTTDTAKNIVLVAVVVFLALGVVSMFIVRAVVAKFISLAVFAVVSLLLLNQRSTIESCASKVRTTIATNPGRLGGTSCKFLGLTVKVPTGS